ncbi:MAG: endonuclease III domain-containing protein [Planctomycetota bacterium]
MQPAAATPDQLLELYDRLLRAYGPQSWWPAMSRLEVMVGAILVQNTAWENVVRAVGNLRRADLLDARRLHALPVDRLETLIKPAGPYRVKAARLRNLLSLIVDEYGGDIDRLLSLDTPTLRERLLAVSGVGKETADSILLYAAERPTFVVDAYTHRLLTRHGWLDPRTPAAKRYDAMQAVFEAGLPREVGLYNELHALIVEVGKRHCRSRPRCEGCPLAPMLPDGGPIDPAEPKAEGRPRTRRRG